MLKPFVAGFGWLAFAGSADADFIIRCGASMGYAYFFEGGSVPEGKGGWQKDQISNGQILFVSKGDSTQILIGDVAGMRDVESDGGKVLVTQADTHMITAVVVYPLAIETYAFRLHSDRSEVAWTTVKSTGIVDKGGIMHAECEFVQ